MKRPRIFLPIWAQALVIVSAVALAWSNSLHAPFTFDDEIAVTDNPTIRQLSTALAPPTNGGTTTGRPLLNLTLALNHAISGEQTWSYHAANLLIHTAAALVLFGLVRLNCRSLLAGDENVASSASRLVHENADTRPFVLALLWALHPLQTESVTSVAQRSESLCGLFYLLTLYCFARGTISSGTRTDTFWSGVSVFCCLLGMATKEVMVTAPVLVLLYDRTFVAGSFAGAWRARRAYYAGLGATWLLLLALVFGIGGTRGPAAGLGLGVSVWSYLLTQCDALVIYLRLCFWPHPLVADYGNAVVTSWSAVWWQGLGVLVLLGGTGWALIRRPRVGFFGAAFFLILAPSSSVIPLVSQTIAEHRMYLPLAAVLALVLAAVASRLSARALLTSGLVVALVAGAATWSRNQVYLNEQGLWEDVIAHRPANGRAHNNLGRVFYREGRVPAAIASFQRSIHLEPANPFAQFNLGLALLRAERVAEAEAPLRAAIALEPSFFFAHLSLGTALGRLGRGDEGLRHFAIAERYAPWSAEIHFQWGVALARLGRTADAIAHYQACLGLDPQRADAESNWGALLLETNAVVEAAGHFEAALRLNPAQAGVHFNLGQALAALGRAADALPHYAEAVRLDPAHAAARLNFGIALAQAGRLAEAIAELQAAARLRSDDPQVQTNLGVALGLAGRTAEALKAHAAALALKPTDARAHYNFGYALLDAGRETEARPHFEAALRLQPDFRDAQEILARLRDSKER